LKASAKFTDILNLELWQTSSHKLMVEIGGAEAVGPILLGLKKKPVHVLQLEAQLGDCEHDYHKGG